MPGPKKAPRSKGNVKPSSSSQAAQLLEASGFTNSGFIGFSKEPAFVPASEIFDDAEAGLDGDIRLVLRKFSKRDTVTKIKALQEFMSLCSSKDIELIKAVVPFWPRIYNKLAIDVDHKVRELTQKALLVLAEKTGKCIAPHLKSIMGIWLVSMCDTYPTVASAANNAFTSTFNAAKQAEALVFCKTEAVECLMNNILKATPQTLSDPQTTSEQDMEAKFEKVVSSSLQALRKLILLLPADSVASSLNEPLTTLLGSSVFWKHSKSAVTSIKSATLSLLSAVCQRCPNVSASSISKIAPFIVLTLDSNEPLLLMYTWEATLAMINAHEDCWNYVNWQKAVWPKIKRILETGCCGQAGIVSPCLLPLLSKIPNPNYKQFFESFRAGLCEIRPVQSPSDLNALVKSFTECIHYSIKRISDIANEAATIDDLISHQLLLVVEPSLMEQQTGLSRTELFVSLATLMESVDSISPKTAAEFWKELATFAAEKLELEYLIAVEKNSDFCDNAPQAPHIFQSILMLMQALVFHEAATSVKERVRFTEEDTRKTIKKPNLGKTKMKLSPSMENFVSDVYVQVFTLSVTSEKSLQFYMVLLKDLSSIHIPIQAVMKLNENLPLDPAKTFPMSCEEKIPLPDFVSDNDYLTFLTRKLVQTLLVVSKTETISQAGNNFAENLILTILSTLTYVDKEEGTKVLLFILDNLEDVGLKCQFIELLLGLVEYIPSCKHLLDGPQMIDCLKNVTEATIARDTAKNQMTKCIWKLFSTVLDTLDQCTSKSFTASSIDLIISQVISSQKTLLRCSKSFSHETIIVIIDVIKKLFSHKVAWTHHQLGDVVLNFISLILSVESDDLAIELNKVWLQGFVLILEKKSHAETQEHISTMSGLINKKLLTEIVSHSCLSRVKSIVNSSACLVATGKEDLQVPSSEADFDLTALSDIIDRLLIVDTGHVEIFKDVCDYYYLSNCLPYAPCELTSKGIPLESYATISIHNIDTLTLYVNIQSKTLSELQWSKSQLLCLLELSHSLLILEGTLKMDMQTLKDYVNDIDEMRNKLLQCFKSLTKEQLSSVVSSFLERNDKYWATYCQGLQHILDLLKTNDDSLKLDEELFVLKTLFLTRIGLNDVISFDVSNISEQSVIEALDSSLQQLLIHEEISLLHLADLFSGWLSLATDYKVLDEKLKDSFFQHIVDTVKHLKTKNIQLLSGGDSNVSLKDLHWNILVSRVLKAVVAPANPKYWEFTLCTLVEWIQFLLESKVSQGSDFAMKSLLVSVADLSYLAAETFSLESSPVTENSKTEWNEFFSEAVFSPLLQIFVSLCSDTSAELKPCWTLVLESVSSVISLCPAWIIVSHQLPARLTATDLSCLPDSLKTLLNHLCPLLVYKLRFVEVAAYLMLSQVMDEIPKHDSGLDAEDKQDDETRSPPEALIQVIESAGHFLGFLKVIQIDDHIVMDRDTEEYAQTLGYLLAWKLLLQLFKSSTNQMRAKYAQHFKVSNCVNCLLDNLFRLMPQHPSTSILNFDCLVGVKAELNDTELAWFSLCVYRQCLEILPALVRSWWVDQDRKAANFIDRFTTEYLSGSLIRQQILAAQNTDKGMEDITIRARPAAREVLATYQMSEVTINMTIVLPENYPLGKLEVTCDKRVGVSQAQWDRWLLQLNIFLQHQNGSIVEGLRLWKGNIDKKFEGIEDCMICFSVIHGTTFQLPRLTCRTCRKKFHSACLYKWFSTSQKSSCPLCRNLF